MYKPVCSHIEVCSSWKMLSCAWRFTQLLSGVPSKRRIYESTWSKRRECSHSVSPECKSIKRFSELWRGSRSAAVIDVHGMARGICHGKCRGLLGPLSTANKARKPQSFSPRFSQHFSRQNPSLESPKFASFLLCGSSAVTKPNPWFVTMWNGHSY